MLHKTVEILLVEDSIDDAELTIRELKKHNVANEIFHVSDGAQAVDYIFAKGTFAGRIIEQRPKLVLLDIQMPKLNGIEVLEAIKADERTKTIPVVMLTSSKEDPDIQRCYQLGVNSYIVKPVNFEAFTAAIRSIHYYWLLLNEPPVK